MLQFLLSIINNVEEDEVLRLHTHSKWGLFLWETISIKPSDTESTLFLKNLIKLSENFLDQVEI